MIGLPQGIYEELSDSEYHGDAESLSSSGARKLLECPAKFYESRRAGEQHSDTFDIGKAFHAKVLGFGNTITVVDAKDWRTKAAQQARDEARASGAIPLLTADATRTALMAGSIQWHEDARRLLEEGIAERSLFWHNKELGVMLRARPDWTRVLPDGRLLLIDVKSSISADPREFSSSAAKYGYAFQEAWYRHVHEQLGMEVAEFLFIVTEKQAPYLTSVVRIDPADIERERPRVTRACEIYAECTRSGIWPGYPAGINDISLPAWYRAQIEKESL